MNGTTSTATACAPTGRATAASSASSPSASPAPPTCTRPAAASRMPASTSSPRMTASRSRTWSSYNQKHNEANGEDNRDGSDNNRSWNCGRRRPHRRIRRSLQLRERQKRNLIATLLLSQGVPMLLAGDELGRTQGGNNNPYCQDNEISWLNWELDPQAARVPGVRRAGDRLAAQSCDLLAPPLPHGQAGGRGDFQGHHLVHAGRHRDDRIRLAAGLRPLPRRAPVRCGGASHRQSRPSGAR